LKNIFFLLFLTPFITYAQSGELELESLDDLKILESFENESDPQDLIKDQSVVNDKEFSTDDLSLEQEMLEDLDLESEMASENTSNERSLKETVEVKSIEKNLRPKYKNLIRKDEVSLDEELDFQDLSEDNIKAHTQKIKDFEENTKPISIDKIIYAKEKVLNKRFSDWEKTALKIQLEDIAMSELSMGQIFKGTKLINIKTNKTHYLPKTITVRFHERLDLSKNRYIRSKEGELSYKTFYRNISNIDKVSNLYRSPYEFKRLKRKEKDEVFDKDLPGIFKFNIHTGLNSPNYTRDLLNETQSVTPVLRLEGSYITNKSNFFETGLVLMYESLSGDLENGGSYSFDAYSLGINLLSPNLVGKYGLIIQPRLSLFSNLSISDGAENYNVDMVETTLLIGLERELNFGQYGRYSFGLNYQRKWYQADSKNVILDLNTTSNYDDSIAFSFGFRFY
jgi:hypothetical protein